MIWEHLWHQNENLIDWSKCLQKETGLRRGLMPQRGQPLFLIRLTKVELKGRVMEKENAKLSKSTKKANVNSCCTQLNRQYRH